MRPELIPIPLIFIAVFLLIRAEIRGARKQAYIFKPTATLLVILVAMFSFLNATSHCSFSLMILAGLLLSLIGDVALLFQQRGKAFLIGLASFLLAHVVYSLAFLMYETFTFLDLISLTLLTSAGIAFYQLIKAGLGAMKIPVVAYIIIISIMVNRAFAALGSPAFGRTQALFIAFGALLFYISDMILAAHRFWKPLKRYRINLAFYYAGQVLIALSASHFG